MSNNERLSESPVEDEARRSIASAVFLSNTSVLEEWAAESTELKCIAVRYFHARFVRALDATSSGSPRRRQWFAKSNSQKTRLDYSAYLRLFPGLQRVGHAQAQASWKMFQPADVRTCLRVISSMYANPHEFIFAWFSATSSFGLFKKKDVMSKKECKTLLDNIGPQADIPCDSMTLHEFTKLLSLGLLSPLLSIFDILPSRDEEKAMIQLSDTTDGFVVSTAWWNQWLSYVSSHEGTFNCVAARPSSIYNLDLLEHDQLKPHLQANQDYVVVTAASWATLLTLYGGGPAIPFHAKSGAADVVNVFLAERDGRPSPQHRLVNICQPIPANALLSSLALMFELDMAPTRLRLWHRKSPEEDWTLWNEPERLLEYALVEMQTSSYEWPRPQLKSPRDFRPLKIGDAVDAYDCERVWRCGIVQRVSTLETNRVCIHFTGFSSIYDEWIHQDSGKLQPRYSRTNPSKYWNTPTRLNPGFAGAVGLLNLGNTCFLNCALQCLSATSIWRSYFLQKLYTKDICRNNKFGTKGKIVHAFGGIMAQLWANRNTCMTIVSPNDFRKVFSKCKPQFDGFDQHDGHEYIASLLDAIHEDLNHPQTQTTPKLQSAQNDIQLGHEAWARHLLQNQSVVVDVFHGLLRSQTTCNQCAHRRVQFEPSLFLSLPIAQLSAQCVLRVWVHPLEAPPRLCEVVLKSSEGNAKMVLDSLAEQMQLHVDRLRLIHVQSHRFARLLPVDTLICDFEKAILCCFERKYTNQGTLSIVDIQVIHRINGNQLIGLPFVLSVDSEILCKEMHSYLDAQLQKFLDFPPSSYSVRGMQLSEVGSSKGVIIPSSDDALLTYYMPPQILVLDWTSDEFIRRHDDIQSILTPAPRTTITLDLCLSNFMKKEEITDDCWKCDSCQATNGGTRQMDIWRAPDVVMIHLKRFHYSMVQHNKMQELVQFPLEGLDLKPYIGAPMEDPNSCLYDLYAVVNHTGGLSEGHYTAYCRYDINPPKGLHPQVVAPSHLWLNFDDEIVSEIPPANVVTNAAYVLFYRRRVLSGNSILRTI
ncbi:unnamed protein product [Aphanomyces euteiches]|uniref:Uncharacterized protein n=1 Tax=Aphanomyces euteiches TaxID=100861 RepID=A0A6G0XC45_9STRA|nr:hypothetical protein Ae201684_006364 [Aphanomyces euteiches]KAH9090720.1 hypothetical protein Ae201684P_006126 [Aphanomyces euteiches]